MSKEQILLLLTVFIPVVGSFILPLSSRISTGVRNFLSFLFVFASLVGSLCLVPDVVTGGKVEVFAQLPLGFNFVLVADCLAVFMAVVSSLISSIIVIYSTGYISHYEEQNEYYLMVVLFLGSMMGLVFSGNLILLYVFWELTAITSWRLIGFFREKDYVVKADKAFIVTVFGALMMLLGFVMIYMQNGTLDLDELKGTTLSNLVVLLIMFGILSKSATLPFHTWLPDAGVAPSPVTALLHAAVLVKIGVYVFARIFIATFAYSREWHELVMAIAAFSALVSAGAALVDTNMKRIIAYSTVSQIAFIFMGFATGVQVGIAGALLYILMHGLAKGGLFLCAGIVEQNTHTKDITKLGGLIRTMPVTAVSFLLCALSVMGIPPFGGFFSKFMVINGAVQSGNYLIAGLFIIAAFMTILYLFRLFNLIFLGEPGQHMAEEKSPVMVACVAMLAAAGLVVGIFISAPMEFAKDAAELAEQDFYNQVSMVEIDK